MSMRKKGRGMWPVLKFKSVSLVALVCVCEKVIVITAGVGEERERMLS